MEDVRMERLAGFFADHPKVALAFSGGTDSSFLLHCAVKSGCDVHAYYVSTEFQPEFELSNAIRICGLEGADLTVLELSVLSDGSITGNGPDRCYHCKRAILRTIIGAAGPDGYPVIVDGTNSSDPEGDRPGMRALREFGIISPLKLSGISKSDVGDLSRGEGLPTWDLPSYSCLATRIRSGIVITGSDLERIDRAEAYLRYLGLSDFRVRLIDGDRALIQVTSGSLRRVRGEWDAIETTLSYDFDDVALDPEPRK